MRTATDQRQTSPDLASLSPAELQALLAEKDRLIAERDHVIADHRRVIADHKQVIGEQQKLLKLLEEELGVKLFVRKGKSLSGITLAGHQVISRARSIMREVEEIRVVVSQK